MVAFIQTGICFLAVCLFCIFLIKKLNVPSGLAPLAVLSCTLLYFTLAGCLGILSFSVWIYFALAIGCGVISLVFKGKSSNALLSPAFLLFLISSVGLLCLLAARKPFFNEWDDFSLWGTAAKMTVETNTLFPAVESGFPWAVSQKPGLIIMAYFFNFFGEFAPWRLFFSYDIIMLAAFAAVCSCVTFKKWQTAVLLYAVCSFIPFINVYTRMIYFTSPYLTGYADIPMGILMGGGFAFYYSATQSKHKGNLFWLCAIMGAITLCKDTGMPIALLCAAVISMDIFINCKGNELVFYKAVKGLWAKLAFCGSIILAVGVSYFGYSKFLGSLGVATATLGGEGNMSAAELVINGLLMLFGLNPLASGVPFVEKFSLVFRNMTNAFFTKEITILGTGLSVFGFAICILIIAYALSADKLHRRRIALFGSVGLLSFIPYYLFIGFTYVFIFKGEQGINLIDYNRYVGCYYAALIIGAIVLLCLSAIKEQRFISLKGGVAMLVCGLALPCAEMIISTISLGRKIPTFDDLKIPFALFCLIMITILLGYYKKASAFVCLLLAFEALMLFNYLMPSHLCIVDYPDVIFDDINILQSNADSMNKSIGKKSKIFYISCEDYTGGNWFKYHYALYPSILDYSYGGGDIADRQALGLQNNVTLDVSIGQFAAYLYKSSNEYLFIDSLDVNFVNSYQALFQGEITTGLYKINKKPDASIYEQEASGTQQSRLPNSIAYSDYVWCMDNPEQFLNFTLVDKGANIK